MSKVKTVFGRTVLLKPIEDDMTERTSLVLPDELKRPQNIGEVIMTGPLCKHNLDPGDLVVHQPSTLRVTLEGVEYLFVNEKEIIGRITNE